MSNTTSTIGESLKSSELDSVTDSISNTSFTVSSDANSSMETNPSLNMSDKNSVPEVSSTTEVTSLGESDKSSSESVTAVPTSMALTANPFRFEVGGLLGKPKDEQIEAFLKYLDSLPKPGTSHESDKEVRKEAPVEVDKSSELIEQSPIPENGQDDEVMTPNTVCLEDPNLELSVSSSIEIAKPSLNDTSENGCDTIISSDKIVHVENFYN